MKTNRIFLSVRRFIRDDAAAVMLQFTIFVAAMLGLVGLTLDGSRFVLLNNDLQDMADAAALAGAAELDGASDALTRADTAARTLLQNNPRWSDVAGAKIESVTFYRQLNPDVVTIDPKQASFIKVTTGSWQVAPTFLAAVGVASNNATSATAVAGASFTSCVPVASFLCNPFETNASRGDAASFPGSLQTGMMFHLLAGTGAPGNWGPIDDPNCGSNPHCYTAFFARVSAGVCTPARVSPRPGNGAHQKITDGINVRFDRPQGSGDLSTAAPIVIDGLSPTGKGNSCNRPGTVTAPGFDPNTNYAACNQPGYSCPLPRDRAFSNGIGGGPAAADLDTYWQNQHGANWPSGLTRYQAYQQEVAGTGSAGTWRNASVEPHGPQCSASIAGASRRVMSVAIIDCNYWSVAGNSADNVLYVKYADFFITEPASNGSVYAEYIQTHSVNGPGSKLYRTVKLYR